MSAPEPDEAPWCEHPECHDHVHGDGTHLDEHGRPFRSRPGPEPDEDPP